MAEAPARQSLRFLVLYGLAAAGGAVAYVPFLTVLLPVRITALSGSDNVGWLASVTFAGAVAASLANIGFGWLSDRTGQRRLWIALGMAISCALLEAALFAYLFFWLRTFVSDFSDSDTARLFGLVLVAAIPLSFAAGRWADRGTRPLAPLALAAGTAAIGLAIMALAQSLSVAIAGYIAFSLSASVFLAQHSSQVLRVLPRPSSRGRDLGLFNLTNTMPSLVMPVLAIALVPQVGFAGLFVLLAVLAAGACIMLRGIDTQR